METKKRLDAFVSEQQNCSKSFASKLIANSCVSVNGKTITKSGFLVKQTDQVVVIQKEVETNKKETDSLKEWKKEIPIVYEDKYIYVVNKPSGIITHPTSHETNNTLANALKFIFKKDESIFKIPYRYGIMHRLDKDTSGLLMVAKDQKSLEVFTEMIQKKEITRKYLALINGKLKTKVVEIQAPIKRIKETNKMEVSNDYDADDATTIFTMVYPYKNFSIVSCELKTGKTHQIRVHAKYMKNPIINDPVYGNGKATKYGQFLVANELAFFHPFLKKQINIKIDQPKEFSDYIKKHGKE